jgi:hypothetical protein
LNHLIMNEQNLRYVKKYIIKIGLAILFVALLQLVWAIEVGLAGTDRSAGNQPSQMIFCPALPPPTGNIIDVDTSQAAQLDNIVAGAKAGDTISLADGTYDLNGGYLRFAVPGVTLRSASGNREAVIIDGGYQTNEIVQVVASQVTIADLTLKRAYYHPVHVMSTDGKDTLGTKLYNLHIIDPGQQAVKINPATANHYTDEGELACSHIELTDSGRPQIWAINGSCYTGGVDAHQAQDWVIRDNLIEGFWCDQGLSEHAIHFWRGGRDTIVERNIMKDNARGVGFGLGQDDGGRTYNDGFCSGSGYVGHYGGVIRNNFIFQGRPELQASGAGFECGVCLAQACETKVFHNSVVSTAAPFSSIEWRFANTDAEIVNNIASHNLMPRNGASAVLSGNLAGAPLSLFVDGAAGNLHLKPDALAAIDQGEPLPAGMSPHDIDGDLRAGPPDIGADELPIELLFKNYLPYLGY